MNRLKLYRIILVLDIALWTFIIFSLSNQNGTQSSGLSRRVVEFFIHNEEIVEMVEPYVRKLAHLTEYAFGGTLFISLFYSYEWTDRRKITTSILLGVWYASIDEIHQLLVEARSGSIVDVYIDTLGFSIGVFGMLLIIKLSVLLFYSKKKVEGTK